MLTFLRRRARRQEIARRHSEQRAKRERIQSLFAAGQPIGRRHRSVYFDGWHWLGFWAMGRWHIVERALLPGTLERVALERELGVSA